MSMIQDKNYPQAFESTYLEVGEGHKIYLEQLGDPKGIPIIFLHGGPGSGFQHNHKLLFNQKHIRLIMFDQRGAGKSLPKRCLISNTTNHLVSDMEFIRKRLGIKQWIVVGGSWGSTLAIKYSETCPENVNGLILRSIFLGTDLEIHWAFSLAARKFRPELWEKWVGLLPEKERLNPIKSYGKRLESDDPSIYLAAAQAWSDYEAVLSQIESEAKFISSLKNFDKKNIDDGPNTPYFEWHYIKNNFFLKKNELLENASVLKKIPGYIIQGRYDLLCPPQTAQKLSLKWKLGRLKIVDEGAHSANTGSMRIALEESINSMFNSLL